MAEKPILLSEKQFETLKLFFSNDIVWQRIDSEGEKTSIRVDDILYWGWARWWKSWLIWNLIAICIKAFPWSSWLVARTQLSHLKATTLATAFKVLPQFWITPELRKDKIKDQNHIEFKYGWDICRSDPTLLYVMQVNLEPSDPQFDRVGSYGYSWAFLDEAQQMDLTLKEVLDWRLSELNGSFEKEIPEHYYDEEGNLKSLIDEPPENIEAFIEFPIKIIWEVTKPWQEPVWKDYVEVVQQWGQFCHVKRIERLIIPYTFVSSRIAQKWSWRNKKDQLIHRYSWDFKWCIFSSCNPWRNFTYTEFYEPYNKWLLKTDPNLMNRAFIPALATDNPFVPKTYIDRLKRLPETSVRKQRLLYGNFDYNDDTSFWFSNQTIWSYFTWLEWYFTSRIKFATIDASRKWKDGTELFLWEWLHCYKQITIKVRLDNSDRDDEFTKYTDNWLTHEQASIIKPILLKEWIDIYENCIVDEVWNGWGLMDALGCKWFIGNAPAKQKKIASKVAYRKENYLNMRAQAFAYLAKYTDEWKIRVTCPKETEDEIRQQLLLVKQKDQDKDWKIQLESKDNIKRALKWKSPDKADAMSMRMYWIIEDFAAWVEPEEDVIAKWDKPLTQFDILIQELEEEQEKEEKKLRADNNNVDFDVY